MHVWEIYNSKYTYRQANRIAKANAPLACNASRGKVETFVNQTPQMRAIVVMLMAAT